MLLLRNRYDVRGALLLWSMALRLAAIAIGASIGVIATFVGDRHRAGRSRRRPSPRSARRAPPLAAAAAEPLGDDAPEIRAFAIQSTVASGLTSLRGLLPTVLVGDRRDGRRRSAYFRIAQAPQTAFASLSAPARLVLLAEQTRDVEHGRADRAYALLRRYIGGAVGARARRRAARSGSAMPTLVRWVYGARYVGATDAVRLMLVAAAIQLIFGWTKSFPVSIGRPGLRTAGQLRRDRRARAARPRLGGPLRRGRRRRRRLIGSSLVLGRVLARSGSADARRAARRVEAPREGA